MKHFGKRKSIQNNQQIPLKPAEVATLYQAIIDVLARAVEAGGTTIRTYLNALGEAGTFQIALNVYGQTGLPCNRCGTPIVKNKSGTTWYALLSTMPTIERSSIEMTKSFRHYRRDCDR